MGRGILGLIFGIMVLGGPSYGMTIEELQKMYTKDLSRLPDDIEISFRVEELGSGKVIYSHNASNALIPASGMKIITSAAALDLLGPSWTTHTEVLVNGEIKQGILQGDLIIRGEGDPYLVSERLWLMAREVARAGIKEISGGIKVNDTYFDQDPGDLVELGRGQPYASKLAATSLNFNSVEIHVYPRVANGKAFIEFGPLPHEYGEIKNEVELIPGTKRNVAVESLGMKNGKEIFRVYGELGKKAKPITLYNSVEDTASYVANVFAAMLKNEGIKTGKNFAGLTDQGKGEVIADLESLPILELIRLANTYSNNFMAEQIFRMLGAKRYGQPASKEKARMAAGEFLKAVPECVDTKVFNGSGLSWDGRVSSLCFVKLLQKSYRDFRGFADLVGSMPVGNGTGTLKSRFSGFGSWFDPWKVRAKTGTLWSQGAVTALIGFVPSHAGDLFVFSVILNHKVKGEGPIAEMRMWEEKSVSYLQKLDGL